MGTVAAVTAGRALNNINSVNSGYGMQGLPPDVALEEQALNRKQQIANLLLQQGMQGAGTGQMVGRFFVPTSASQHAAGLGQVLAGALGTRHIDTQRQDMAQAMNQERARAIQEYIKKTSPTEQQPTMPVDSTLVPPTFDIEQLQPDQARQQERFANQTAMANTATDGEVQSGNLAEALYNLPNRTSIAPSVPAQNQVPAGAPIQQPPDPAVMRQAILDGLTNQDPRVQGAVKFMEEQKAREAEKAQQQAFLTQEKEAQRAFQGTENQANRDNRLAVAEGQLNQAMMLGLISKDQKDQMLALQAQAEKDRASHNKATESIQQQDLALRKQQAELGKVPPGYRKSAEGNLEAIPGGPADLKLQGALNADTAMLQGTNAAMDRLGSAANALLNHPGLTGITGIRGKIYDVPGTDAANARADLNNLKSQIAFTVMQELRNNSKSGSSGLGALSDAEGKRLEAAVASLDTTQDLDQFKQRLQAIIDYSNGAKDRLRDSFNLKHKSQMTPSAQSGTSDKVPTIANDADFDKLPSGAVFIDPSGVKRKKP